MTPMIHRRDFPEWLAPHKNEWLTVGGIIGLIKTSPMPTSVFMNLIKSRIQSKTNVLRISGKLSRHYLVKQVWACAMAHGLEVSDAKEIQKNQGEVRALNNEIRSLQNQIAALRSEAAMERKKKKDEEDYAKSRSLLAMMANISDVRPIPGVYFLLSGTEIVYIGTSKNVIARMSGHTDKTFDCAKMIHIADDENRYFVETTLISILNPYYNTNKIVKSVYEQIHGDRKDEPTFTSTDLREVRSTAGH